MKGELAAGPGGHLLNLAPWSDTRSARPSQEVSFGVGQHVDHPVEHRLVRCVRGDDRDVLRKQRDEVAQACAGLARERAVVGVPDVHAPSTRRSRLRQLAAGSSTSTGSGIPAPGPPAGGPSITISSAVVVAAPPFASATTVTA